MPDPGYKGGQYDVSHTLDASLKGIVAHSNHLFVNNVAQHDGPIERRGLRPSDPSRFDILNGQLS